MACRINRQRVWSFRLELESRLHASSIVVTLTYEKLPEGGSLVPRDATLWLKRLRKALGLVPLRYFLVGEYGSGLARPHYHAILFGIELSEAHQPLLGAYCRCPTCNLIRTTWGLGRVQVDGFSRAAARYVCGYVTKKLTKPDDPRLGGKHPEFTRMSLRPGIARDAVPRIAETVNELRDAAKLQRLVDVPSALRSSGQMQPLGRYLVGKLREAIGRDHRAPALAKELRAQELRSVSETAGTANAYASKTAEVSQKARQVIARHRIYALKESL